MAFRRFLPLLLLCLECLRAQSALPAAETLLKEWASLTTEESRQNFLRQRGPFATTLPRELWTKGEALQRKSLYDEALNHYSLGTAIAQLQNNDIDTAIGLQLAGGVYRLRGRYKESIESYNRAREFAIKSGDKLRLSFILSNLSNVYVGQSRFSEGLRLLQESLEVVPANAPPTATAAAHQNMAIAYALQGDYRRSLEKFATVLAIYEKADNRPKIALTVMNLGVLHSKQGNYETARVHLTKALKLGEELNDPTLIGQTLNELGLLLTRQDRYREAIIELEKAREIIDRLQLKQLMGDVRNSIADIYSRQGRQKEALPLLEQAAKIFEALNDKNNLARTFRGTSEALDRTGQLEPALTAVGKAIDLSRQVSDVEGEWQGRTLQARILKRLGRLDEARFELENAVAQLESQRLRVAGGDEERQRYFERAMPPYHSLIEIEVAAKRPFNALRYAERAKARILLDVLSHGPEQIEQGMTASERDEERSLLGDLAGIEAQLHNPNSVRPALEQRRDDLRLKQTAFMSRLYANHPDLQVLRGSSPVLNLEQLTALVPLKTEALIQYVSAEECTWMFVVTRNQQGAARVEAWKIPVKRSELTERAAQFRDAIARRDPGFRKYSRALYDVLLKPAAASLAGKTRVRLVPDGPLWELPFQALTSPAGRYWIEDVTISLAPSFTALRDLNSRQTSSATRLVAMGDPIRTGFLRVPETSRQVNLVSTVHGASNSQVFVGSEATESRFRKEAATAGILHLATHGDLNEQSPLYSRLVFSEPKTTASADDDGYLEAWELLRMKLNVRLAVLSACESGRGQVAYGEGMIGLNWALFVAGVPTSIVSQWKVEAASSTALFGSFYKALKKGSGAAVALRSAALAVKADRRYQHPFYWAPFILVGKDDRL